MALRRRGARTALIALLLAAALALLGVWKLAFGRSSPSAGDPAVATAEGVRAGDRDERFSVSGSVTGLFPGAHADFVVTVKNAMPFPIRLTRLSATVGNANATCTAANLSLGGFSGSRDVPAKGSATVMLPVTMAHAAGDGCQGAHFPLMYSATATRADAGGDPTPGGCGPEGDEPCD